MHCDNDYELDYRDYSWSLSDPKRNVEFLNSLSSLFSAREVILTPTPIKLWNNIYPWREVIVFQRPSFWGIGENFSALFHLYWHVYLAMQIMMTEIYIHYIKVKIMQAHSSFLQFHFFPQIIWEKATVIKILLEI